MLERVRRGLRSAEPATVYLGAGLVVGGALLSVVAWALFAVGSIRRAVAGASLVGVFLCLVAVGAFAAAYPGEWNVSRTDYSLVGVTIYALGLACLGGALGAAVHARYPGR